jgi:hypothetical protein
VDVQLLVLHSFSFLPSTNLTLGFGILGLGLGFENLGFRILGLGLGFEKLGFGILGLRFGV